ncbi:hypothetical protein Pint_19378 [Pistacia integerrima]|uniref:Uncharacterized protein n=1 Tax=Pistacia integerrima TaxID=434235 RepID=A0ACC0YY66_9ROSI|nr:hypothetical protein Pint_19378 [Pistacia integerrima]
MIMYHGAQGGLGYAVTASVAIGGLAVAESYSSSARVELGLSLNRVVNSTS